MSSVDGQAFLGGDDNNNDDDFAALDSMSYSGIMSPSTGFANLTSSSPAVPSSSSGGSLGIGGSAMGDGRENGFPGVSGSLFDRIRARTEAEQQSRKQQNDNVGAQQYNQLPPQSQVSSGQSSQEQQQQQQQQQQSAFVSQQNQQHQPSAFMSHHPQSQVDDYSFNNNNETTYAANNNSGGENFSHHNIMAPVHAPTYQNRSNDPYNAAYAAMGGEQQNNMSSALARASDAAKSIFGAGIGSVVSVGTLAKDKIVAGIAGTGSGGGGGGGGRSYTNSFLLREDSIEGGMQGIGSMQGMGGGGGGIQPPPPIETTGGGASDQAYSMIRYGKTFVEDVYLFVQQLPTWGKGVLGVFVLIGLWLFFG